MVESLQRVAAALLQDVVEVEDEHHDHALLVLHRDDVSIAQEVGACHKGNMQPVRKVCLFKKSHQTPLVLLNTHKILLFLVDDFRASRGGILV